MEHGHILVGGGETQGNCLYQNIDAEPKVDMYHNPKEILNLTRRDKIMTRIFKTSCNEDVFPVNF